MQFKSKVMSAAVAVALGVAGSAHAAFLSEDGLGQVLLFPYYTVNGGYDTYITITNTTSQGKAVKVRFLEGKNSQEVLDFNLYLSKFDSWFAGVTASGTGAKVVALDNTCTAPTIPAAGKDFRNSKYASMSPDMAEKDLSRVREGYVEVIEMGTILDGTVLANWITHNSAGVPANCNAVSAAWFATSTNQVTTGNLAVAPVSGGIYGTGSLLNVAQGTDYSYDAVAIDAFTNATLAPQGLHFKPGNASPSLANVDPVSTVVGINTVTNEQTVLKTAWGPGNARDAISAVLQRSAVYNDYLIEPALSAGTDIVVTFPTKHLYQVGYTATTPGTADFPFTNSGFTSDGACESISLVPYSREEQTPGGAIDFSPAPVAGTALCWEANVLTLNNTSVLGSLKLGNNLNPGYTSGWLNLSFNGANQALTNTGGTTVVTAGGVVTTARNATYAGLPVIGFSVQKYGFNGLGFGGSFIGKYTRNITSGANTYR